MKQKIHELFNAGYGKRQVARLLNISVTEVSIAIAPMRYPNRVWADMLRLEGFDNERIAELLDMKLSSVKEFFGEREAPNLNNRASGFIGVKDVDGRWQARVKINNCKVNLGLFDDPISAAWTRDNTVRENKLDCDLSNPPERRAKPR